MVPPPESKAVIDVLNNRAQVMFFLNFVNAETIRETIEDVGFQATLIADEGNEKSTLVCRIRIKGMTCTSCFSTVESALQAVPGVQKAQVALATEEADVHYDPKIVNCNQLMVTVEDTGFEAILINSGEDMSKIDLKVDGVRTDHSMRILEQSLKALPGVQGIDIHYDDRKISLSYKPDMTGPRDFIKVIETTGFRAKIYPGGGAGRENHRKEEIQQYYSLSLEFDFHHSGIFNLHGLHVHPWT